MQYSMIGSCVCLAGGVKGRGREIASRSSQRQTLEGRKCQSLELMTNCEVGGAGSESGR